LEKQVVLVTATGSIIGEGLVKCLKLANTTHIDYFSYEIVTVDMRSDAAGLYRGHFAELIPSPREESKYLQVLERLCKKYSVRAIFCGSDEELFSLAKLAPVIEKETGAKVISNPPSTLQIAVDKWKTFQFLAKAGLDYAKSSLPENKMEFVDKIGFPLIVKPRSGHGSLNLFFANNLGELDFALQSIERAGGEPLIQEYLPGDDAEFTTGVVMSGRKTGLVLSSISMKRRLKHGQTYKAFVEDEESVRQSCEKTAIAIGATGPINVQSRLVNGESKAFEINPRFSASCPIRAMAGVNEPDIVYRDQVLKEDVPFPSPKKIVGLRYWSEVYVPLNTFNRASKEGLVRVEESVVPDYF
jgi:carbamoyl-phosphate synthase large subunit